MAYMQLFFTAAPPLALLVFLKQHLPLGDVSSLTSLSCCCKGDQGLMADKFNVAHTEESSFACGGCWGDITVGSGTPAD